MGKLNILAVTLSFSSIVLFNLDFEKMKKRGEKEENGQIEYSCGQSEFAKFTNI